jgi:threonylcarbamoyladenosine tRNA methylthiotransferase MtaB
VRAVITNHSPDDTGVSSGAKEIVLTGVHLGSWGSDSSPRLHLRDLVQAILAEADPPRLRLSSLEPWDLDENFFSLWKDLRLCRHLHLPLQSGCAATLRRMARKTTPRAFSALLEAARAAIPDIAITTDIITGFPGEDEHEFSESLAFIQGMQFSGGHVFTYSARPGTSAARMPNQVPMQIRKQRNAQMRVIFAEAASFYRQRFIGKVMPVLWESVSETNAGCWIQSGLTGNYIKVYARDSQPLWNQISRVRLSSLEIDGMHGVIESGKDVQ